VLVDRMSMEDLAQQLFSREGEASAKYYGRLFRDALDVLAVEYGLAGRGR
jgi:plasmid stabilization system protein ParE